LRTPAAVRAEATHFPTLVSQPPPILGFRYPY
jgi:hypothetical protein